MSAPTSLDAGALISGLAWSVHPPEQHVDDLVIDPFDGDEMRSATRIALLTREHNALCTQAVDSFEITAGLEAAGISDRQARALYGAASVFELADSMYALVPRRPSAAVARLDPWKRPPSRHLLRGLLYGLPGLLYAVALITLQAGFDALLLLGTVIFAAGLGQALSVLGHVLIGRGQHAAASALFRTAIVVGVLLGGLIVLASWLSGSFSPAAVLAACLISYLLSATILMVVDANLVLLAVLAPGVALAVVELAGVSAIPREVTLGILGLCVAAAIITAWSRLSTKPKGTFKHLREGFGLARFDFSVGSGYFIYGLATACLAAFAVLDALGRHHDTDAGPIALMMLPLVASLGIAEWLVYRLRSRAALVLLQTTSVGRFRVLARSEFSRAILTYGGALAVLSCAVIFLIPQQPWPLFALNTAAYGVLGMAFFCATLLLSLGRHRLALGLAIVALVVDSLLRMLLTTASADALAVMHISVFLCFLLVMVPVVASQYVSAGAHR